ncbi:MAG: sulfoacetaldehyde dehydrogenase, partial [Pseudomonadota bacterium]
MSVAPISDDAEAQIVDELVRRAREAQAEFEATASQDKYDQAALAAAWALMEPSRNEELSKLAVETT